MVICRRTVRSLVAALLLLVLAGPTPAFADTYVAFAIVDLPDLNPGNGRCISALIFIEPTVPGNTCTLRAAIMEANAHPGPDTILLELDVDYVLDRSGAGEDKADTGDLDITDDVTIIGATTTASPLGVRISGKDDRVFDIHPGATVKIQGVSILSGRADFGGGIRNRGNLTLIDSEVLNNVANRSGGGVENESGGTLTIQNSALFDNKALFSGGGLSVESGSASLTNVTFSGNTTDPVCAGFCGGGAIAVPGGTVSLQNVTINNNFSQGSTGGGGLLTVALASNVQLRNTIVASNTAPFSSRPNCQGPVFSRGHNLEFPVSASSQCGLIAGLADLIGLDPKLGALKNTGGTTPATRTRSLLAGSPAIDTGDNATCPANDQRFVTRPQDGNGDTVFVCDIGAFEFSPSVDAAFTLPQTGLLGSFTLSPSDPRVEPDERLNETFTWTVPAPRTWHDLKSLELRVGDDRDHLIWVRWDEQLDLFSLVDPATGAPGPPGTPGTPTTLETPFATLFLGDTRSTGTGPTGQSVTLTLSLSFKPITAGRSFKIEVRATDDNGPVQGFDPAGTLTVGGPFDNDKDAHHKPRRLTEEQKQQRQRTDTSSLDDTRNEGNVLATRCDEDPPLAIIANRDGQVIVQLLYEARKACRSIRAGDYLEASGEKQTEQLFEAHEVTVTRGGERVR